MDPLSIAASTIALLGLCAKLQQGIKSVRDVPEEITALLDDLQDLWNVLTVVRAVAQQRGNINELGGYSQDFDALLLKARNICLAIANHCGISVSQEDDATFRNAISPSEGSRQNLDLRNRIRWLKNRGRIDQYRRRLQTIRLDIANHLAVLSQNDTCSMLSQLQVLSNAFQQLSIGHPGPQASLVHMKLATTTEDIERATRSPSRDSHPSEVELRYENPSLSPAKPFPKSCNYASLSGCRCSCHRTSAFTTPWAMQYTFGALTVKLQGIPYIAPRCDEATCGKGGHSSLGFSYRFPPWLLNRAIHSLLNHSRVRGPQLNLTCTRIVHRDSAIFVFASEGNITGIQNLFRKGSASLLDVSHDSGLTALHYAVMCGHTELCDFLLKQGASREIQDFGSETSVGCAYSLICIRDVDDWSKQRIQCLFDEDLWLEQQQFTILHKVILGLDKTGRTLADELSVTTREINLPDSTGRTPISWAAELGNQEAVSDLLAFRADPNKDDKGGFSPVHYACLGGHPQILSLLLDNGSSPTKRDILKQTPLMRLGRDDPSLIDKLLARPDVQLNETDEDRWNALWFAAYSSQEKVLSHLLNLGADPNQTNLDGWNVLFSSIGWNRHASVRILLEKSSQSALNLAHCDHDGDDCLHFLAHFADPETASIFLEALQDGLLDLTALDTARVNNKGWTVRDLLARHESHDVRPILEKALAFIEEKKVGERGFLSSEEEEAASDESSVTSEELQYADALELLQHSEEIETEGL